MARTGGLVVVMVTLWLSLALAGAPVDATVQGPDPHTRVRGVTMSTPTWGWEWGTPEMDQSLDSIAADGANWVAIHPYARIHSDGRVSWRDLDPDAPPDWIARPIEQAHRRGLKVMIKPHLAYWGSPFSWRGEIDFSDPQARKQFFADYQRWIVQVAAVSRDADAFVVGTELDRLTRHETPWRTLIAEVHRVHPGPLTYAANWDAYERVPFWDALDAVGIQAYFPLLSANEPVTETSLSAAWRPIVADIRRISARTGKPVVFTELGYDASPRAAVEPWKSGRGGEAVQRRALAAALAVIEDEPTIRGAFLWKWFPGDRQVGDFRLSDPQVRQVLRQAWK